jgi:hypothetical protein
MPSGLNGSSLSVVSPMPMNRMGAPVTSLTLSAAPPRASPSSLVNTTPLSESGWLKPRAVRTASWPIMASTTSSTFSGWIAARIADSSCINASSIASRPAVS